MIEGALFAISLMPADAIEAQVPAILPWTQHSDWWLRHASFLALQGLERKPDAYIKIVPALVEMMVKETHTMPRSSMNGALAKSLKKFGTESEIGQQLAKGFHTAIAKTEVIPGPRSREGNYNLNHAIWQAIQMAPETAPQLIALQAERGLQELEDDELTAMITGGRGFEGLLKVHQKLKGDARTQLETVLYDTYRPELVKRLKAGKGNGIPAIDALLGILQFRDANAGWKILGTPPKQERAWQYLAFEPTAEKDILPKRNSRRHRDITLPTELQHWFMPDFDAKGWQSGPTPIGTGGHPRAPKNLVHRSPWGDGEILLARTTFELDATDYDLYRISMIATQGFDVYLNGKKIQTYTWWTNPGENRKWPMGAKEAALLRKGTNTLAVTTTLIYPSAQKPHWKDEVFGHFDCHIEALRKEDLY